MFITQKLMSPAAPSQKGKYLLDWCRTRRASPPDAPVTRWIPALPPDAPIEQQLTISESASRSHSEMVFCCSVGLKPAENDPNSAPWPR